MKMGIVGLGRMGSAIAYRLVQAGHDVVGFDTSELGQQAGAEAGALIIDDLAHMAYHTNIVWVMVPHGEVTENVFNVLLEQLQAGTIIIDGGNSHYEHSIERAQRAATKGIHFLDCGTSGGVRGREIGFCLMVGGDKIAFSEAYPLLEAIAAPGGVSLIGSSGTGHYVKMVHNGIEYALLQAYAEGFHVIKEGSFKNEGINLSELSRLWNTSSVIRSFILELAHDIFDQDYDLSLVSGTIGENGTGLWTSQEAHKHNIPVPTIDDALKVRAWSRETGGNYATKMVALLRNKFGGHPVSVLDHTQKHKQDGVGE